MRNTVAAMFGAALTFGAGPAFAQAKFGPQGTAAFSADRLFGFYSVSTQVETEGVEAETDTTTIGFAWQGPLHPSPHTVPRLAFDYFVIDSLSIGGSIAYWNISFDDDDDDDDDISGFLFAPRVGYVWMFSDVIGFWLRGGFTYHSYSADGPFLVGGDEHTFNFTFDPVFVITPTEHFGFNFGPLIDITITGERDNPGPLADSDLSYTTFGITAGIFGWL
jgi:hypothetical protein